MSKHAAPDVYYLPGGKPEPGEQPLDCLGRELAEELGVGIESAEPFAEVRAPAALEGVPMWMTVFRRPARRHPEAGRRDRARCGSGRTTTASRSPRRCATA